MSGALSAGPGGGIVPMGSAPINPMAANMAGNYSQMPTEQLQEMAARAGNSPQGQMAQRILQQRHMTPNAGMSPVAAPPQAPPNPAAPTTSNSAQPSSPIPQTPQARNAGVALPPTTNAMKRGGGIAPREHFDIGGVPSGEQDPWWTRREAGDSGLIHAYSPGRTDTMNMEPLAGSYIIPADVISGLGEGNTLAGSAVMDRVLNSGPHGTQMPRGHEGRGPPAPPHVYNRQFDSRGGATEPERDGSETGERVPIVAAGGEYKVSPAQVKALGKGDMKRGHDILDAFVLHVRKNTVKDLQKLPPPKKK